MRGRFLAKRINIRVLVSILLLSGDTEWNPGAIIPSSTLQATSISDLRNRLPSVVLSK